MPAEPVAITGIACRYPGGISSPGSFWEFILNGGDAIREVPDERKALWNCWPDHGRYPAYGGFIDEIDRFDAGFFNISPREARHIDPQQRILLELAWEALEDAGIPPVRLEGRPVGVYVGIFLDEYWDLQRYAAPSSVGMHTNTGGTLSIAANRISYFLDLQGPSIAVDTACSSSLTALHLACRDIQAGTCTAALAGGANLLLSPQTTRGFQQAQMLSPDGRCRAFDREANGYVRSDGTGMVVLKPLAAAMADGDAVYAVVHGSAVNQDGRGAGLTVPDRHAQEAVIAEAARAGGVDPLQLAFVEAHGTGTPTGDPVEAMAIGRATGGTGCLIGSVKTNIGHTEAAAGIAGVIKAALSLKHGILPPSLHFDRPNPDIPFEELGLRVATESVPLPDSVFAGINSFGFGGANAHVVLGSPPTMEHRRNPDEYDSGEPPPRLLVLSAHSTAALKEKASDTASMLRHLPDTPPGDLAATLVLHRSHLDHRLALVFEESGAASRVLETFYDGGLPDRFETGRAGTRATSVVFVFTGMGPQWYGMGKALYDTIPAFREALDEFDDLFAAASDRSIRKLMWKETSGARMSDVEIAQPANMALQWALAALWRSLGIEPQIVVGHSVGEIAGACVAGALSIEEGVRIIYQRSRLQSKMQGKGEMLAVGASFEEAAEFVDPYGGSLSIAAVNSPVSVTISGDAADIGQLEKVIGDRRLYCRKLHTEIAYHSGQMDGIRDDFLAALGGLSPTKTRIPLLSTVTGEQVEGPELDADHWWRNIRNPVLFDRIFEAMPRVGEALYIEVGPHPVLSSAIYENLAHHNLPGHALPTLRRDREAWYVLLEALAKCHVHGHDINWKRLVDPPRTSVPLPTYPWQKERFWLDGTDRQPDARYTHPLIGPVVESSVDPDSRIWDRTISLQSHPDLADHTVLDRPIMPLAGQIEMLFETLDLAEIPVAFTGLRLLQPLLLSETRAHLVQVVRKRDRYTLSSRPESQETASSWVANMRTGKSRVDGAPRYIDLEAVRSRCDRRITNRRFYERAAELGFRYGPAFRHVDYVVYSEREALAFLAPRDNARGSYRLHPGVLDAGLQALLMLLPDDGSYLPAGVESVVLHRLPDEHEGLAAYARLRETSTEGRLLADVYLVDEKGLPVVQLEGTALVRAGSPGDRSAADRNPQGLYREQWIADNLREEHPQPASVSHWFVLSDDRRLGTELAETLSRPGVEHAYIGISDNGSEKNWSTLAGELGSLVCESGRQVGIVGVWTGRGNRRQSARHTGPALTSFELVRTVLDRLDHPDLPISLRLITAGAQSVTPDDRVSPEITSVWGCGRVAMREHPELNCTLIDLPAEPGENDLAQLAEILDADTPPGEIAIRQSGVFTRRLGPFDLQRCKPKTVPSSSYVNRSYRLSQDRPASIEDLRFVSEEEPRPGPDEVVVRVHAAGLNFRDVLTAHGLLEGTSRRPPSFGWECVGEVVARGDRADSMEVGDVVMGMMPASLAGYVCAKAGLVVRIPDNLKIEEAATLPVAFMTAYLGLVVRGGMAAGDRVLIHTATGGVGLAALQLAQHARVEIFATAGSQEKRALLREMGVTHVMDSRSLDFAEEIREKTDGRGVDIVLNTLAGHAMTASLSVLALHGRFVEIGKTDMLNHRTIDLDLFDRNRSYHPIDLAQFIEDHPGRAGELLQNIVGMVTDGRIRPLPWQAFPMDRAREAFQLMSQARHTGKVLLVDDGTPVPVDLGDDDPVVRPGGTYLVTGGRGGIGRFLTEWLLDRGAGRVVVTGRRRSGEAAPEAPDQRGCPQDDATGLGRSGEAVPEGHSPGHVQYVQADVTDRAAMERLMSALEGEKEPLSGVFHAAGVLDDGILLTQTAERFRQVLEPKTTGAWILHKLTMDLELDFFVLFSSAASLVGTAGQASYAAANAYLDGLADLRRQMGLPVTSINWGPWEDTGMAADERAVDRLRRQGLRPIPPGEAGALLDRILQRDVHRVGVVPTTDSIEDSILARYLDLDRREAQVSPALSALSKTDLCALPAERLRSYIEDYVLDAIARIVEMDPGRVEPGQTWRSLGVDSLMAVELRNRIVAGLYVSVPLDLLQSETSIGQTVDKLLEGWSFNKPLVYAK